MVQPYGETMQVPAATPVRETPDVPTYGGAVPRQLTSRACLRERRTSTPRGPAATIFASSWSVSQLGRG
jgi:hypothetical protein